MKGFGGLLLQIDSLGRAQEFSPVWQDRHKNKARTDGFLSERRVLNMGSRVLSPLVSLFVTRGSLTQQWNPHSATCLLLE